MNTYKELVERFVNLIGNDPRKKDHAKEVHALLQKSYEKQGGIHGSGFTSPEDMTKNVHMWKLKKKDNKVVAAAMYKNKDGRKAVAYGTDGSDDGKKHVSDMMKHDAGGHRSYGELSGPALSVTKKKLGDKIHHHVVPYEHVHKHLEKDDHVRRPPHDDPEVTRHPELKNHFYQRKIGHEWHTKLMVGEPGHKFK